MNIQDFQNLNVFTCSSVDLILERLCLEGSRKQAKYAVHALAAITKDDGLMSLSVLYKVFMLISHGFWQSIYKSISVIIQVPTLTVEIS